MVRRHFKTQPMTMPRGRRRKTGGITIDDVAAHAGVSAMTVSRVVNGNPRVSQETRDRVNLAIDALNYVPNVAARRLAAGDSIGIGLIFDNPSAAFFGDVIIGALEECSRAGARLMLEWGGSPQKDLAAVDRLIGAGMTGLLLPPPMSESDVIIDRLEQGQIPVVALAAGKVQRIGAAVGIDDYAAAYAMTGRLLSLGHRRIGFIRGNPDQMSSESRYQGFVAAHRDAGFGVDPDLVEVGLFTFKSGLACAQALLAKDTLPTAIFASNDDMAVATVSVAQRMGLRIPEDVSVVGFDDTPLATTVVPELTTVRQPTTAMARWAVEQLLGDIRRRRAGQQAPQRYQLMAFELVERASIAPPRA